MKLTTTCKNLCGLMLPNLYSNCRNFKRSYVQKNIESILGQKESHAFYDSEKIFEQLQASYKPLPKYGYDSLSTWRRGAERMLRLLRNFDLLHKPCLSILEAGCGDGMTAYLLKGYGHNLTLVDQEDWRDERARDLNFIKMDLTNSIPVESGSFDFIYSYNTFEHLYYPKKTLSELIRSCKKGGYIYLEFGPLYASPWGLHAYETLMMPYPQFLFSKSFIDTKLHQLGIYDLGRKMSSLQPLNQWRMNQYRSLFNNPDCKLLSESAYSDFSHLTLINKFNKCFSGLNLTFDDVTIQALYVTLRKR